MVRRWIAMVLALLLIVSTVSAESLFDTLTSTQTSAPSYGAMKGVAPDDEMTAADGSTEQVYVGVNGDDYNAFGVLLAQRGYTVGEQSSTNDEANFVVVKDDASFRIVYRFANETLTVTYPANVAIETAAEDTSSSDIPQTIETGAVYHYGRVVASSAKLRYDPSTQQPERVTLAENTIVWVATAETDSEGIIWVAATAGNQSGYIKSQQVALMGVNEEKRYRATLDNPMQPPTPAPTASPTPVPTPVPTPKPTAKPTVKPKETRVLVQYVRILEEVNIRKGPFTKYGFIKKAQPDELYLYLGTNKNTGWYKILLEDGREGYVSFNYSELIWQ